MAISFTKECDIGQGYDFKPNEQRTIGYLTQLVVGDSQLPADIRIFPVAPINVPANVVAVLASASWPNLPNESIHFEARVSPANNQQLSMLAMQNLKSVVFRVGFAIYQYDPVAETYFPCFRSYAGVPPTGVAKPANSDPPVVFARLGKTDGAPGIRLDPTPSENPPGVVNFALELTLAPPIAKNPQQILIQTAATNKTIQPWGIPQS